EKSEVSGLVLGGLSLGPLIRNLPADRQLPLPDVSLTTLKPVRAQRGRERLALVPGKLTTGQPLNIAGWPLSDGYGVPTGSDIGYELDPAWGEFAAVIGMAQGGQRAGPFQILLDSDVHWSSEREFDHDEPGEQIVVPLPAGHKT